MFRHILAPLDGSPLAACVFPHIVTVARATGARITLLRVLEPGGHGLAGEVNPFDWQMQKREAQTYLDRLAERLGKTINLPVTTGILEGCAALQIIEYTQRVEADLVVLSSHGYGGLRDWHISSVAQKVIQRAGVSILLVRAWRPEASGEPEHWEEPCYHRILVPLDGSSRAECALPVGSALAEHESTLNLVYVATQPELFHRLPLNTDEQTLLEQVVRRNQQQAGRYLEQLQTRFVPPPHTHVLPHPNVATRLHRFVTEEQIDLVILSAHGFSGQPQWPFGSLTQSFIQYGETPLLIVQDMPLRSSGAILTAIQSTVLPARTASAADSGERPQDSPYVGTGTLADAAYLHGADQRYVAPF